MQWHLLPSPDFEPNFYAWMPLASSKLKWKVPAEFVGFQSKVGSKNARTHNEPLKKVDGLFCRMNIAPPK